jgi:lipase
LEVESYDSPSDAAQHADPGADPVAVQAEVDELLTRSADGRYRWRTRPEAVITAFSDMCRLLPPPVQPTLLVRAAGNPQGTETFAASCAGAAHVRIETLDCGHRLLAEKPAETAALIRSFLDEPSSA